MRWELIGYHTIYGAEDNSPYMTRAWLGRLRLHIFHRPDSDPDCHDHPWDFWTFPLTPYVEEVARSLTIGELQAGKMRETGSVYVRELRVVPAFRISHRPATHMHRVMGRYAGPLRVNRDDFDASPAYDPNRKVVTIVWRGNSQRKWGFLKNRDGKWCWIGWRDYVSNGGKHAPCESREDDK